MGGKLSPFAKDAKTNRSEYANKTVPFLEKLSKYLGDKDYFLGYFTIADLHVLDSFDPIDMFDTDVLDKFPNLRALHDRIEAQEWFVTYKASLRYIRLISGAAAQVNSI